MTGVIWFVQLRHYPLFTGVSPENFSAYEARHQMRTGLVVIPGMLTEVFTGVILFVLNVEFRANQSISWAFLGSLGLLLIIWGSTFFIQVPLHAKLEKAFDTQTIKHLVNSNWIRTVSWSARSLALLYILSIWRLSIR